MKAFYLVIDFEANCSGNNVKDHEIIEFPALLVNTNSGQIVSTFREFIKLNKHKQLSEFIKDLTHITDEQVQNGLEWPVCLKEFEKWLQTNGVNSVNTTIVTCGDWDFLTMFPKQNKAFGIKLSNYMKRLTSEWTNLKVYYRLANGKKGDMKVMLDHFNLELIGHHHSGIDDCKNIHRVCCEMVKLGFDITYPTRSIV